MLKHQSEHALSLKEASMGIEFPNKVEQIVAKLLAKDIQERYQSAQLLTSHLVAVESVPPDNIPATAVPSSIGHEETLSRWLIAISALCTFVAGFAIGYYMPHPVVASHQATPLPKESNSLALQFEAANAKAARLSKFASSPEKFSTYAKKHGQRIFHFPQFPVGYMSFDTQEDQVAAGDLVSPEIFKGIKFQPNLESRKMSSVIQQIQRR